MIAPVVSNNVMRRTAQLYYGNTTQTIANDPGHWDDLVWIGFSSIQAIEVVSVDRVVSSLQRSRLWGCHATLPQRCVTSRKTTAKETRSLAIVCLVIINNSSQYSLYVYWLELFGLQHWCVVWERDLIIVGHSVSSHCGDNVMFGTWINKSSSTASSS